MTSKQQSHKCSINIDLQSTPKLSNTKLSEHDALYLKWNTFIQNYKKQLDDYTYRTNLQRHYHPSINDDEKMREINDDNHTKPLLILKAECDKWHSKYKDSHYKNIKLNNQLQQLQQKLNQIEQATRMYRLKCIEMDVSKSMVEGIVTKLLLLLCILVDT